MSRSYMKHPYIKVKSSGMKKIFNRRLRRKNIDIPDGNAYKKMNESYDIVDYKCPVSWEDFKSWQWIRLDFKNEKEAYKYWASHYKNK